MGVAQQMLELNTLGPIALTRAALPRMLARRKGRLLVVSSMAGKIPRRAYCARLQDTVTSHAGKGLFCVLTHGRCERVWVLIGRCRKRCYAQRQPRFQPRPSRIFCVGKRST